MLAKIVKRQFSIFLSVILAVCMLMPTWALSAEEVYAASVAPSVNGLTASYDKGTWTASGTSLSGSATGTPEGTCDDATSVTSTLTLKNTKGSTAVLSFNYTKPVLGTGGSVKIDGTTVTAAGTFSKELADNAAVTVVILSGNPGAITSGIDLNDIQLVSQVNVTTTFKPAEGGTFTVDGSAITQTYSETRLSTNPYTLKATPASGYKFFAWTNGSGTIISNNANYEGMFETDQTITPVFLKTEDPVFQVGTKWFTDLNEAHSYAVSSSNNTIILVESGTLKSGSYTINSGKTLLIPYSSAYAVNTTEPTRAESKTPESPSVYKKLTMADGANITINGSLCVNARVNSYNNAYTGVTTGKFGQLHLNEGSSIILNNNSNLYSWGYVTGSGSITANSGAAVYEPFQISDIRGGSATSGMNGNNRKVLPFSQYYVQNIEAPLLLKYGAAEYAVGSVTIQSQTAKPKVKFIGSSGAMFTITSGGSFKKTYDPKQDRNFYDIEGSAALNAVTLDAYITINTANYVLPIMENTSIRFHSGTITTNQDLCMIPGSVIQVDHGASVKVASGKNVFIYDRDQWIGGKFIYSSTDLKNSYYSPTRVNADKFTTAKMTDAKLDVNGTVEAAGNVYTTLNTSTGEGGADITSSEGTGIFKFTAAPTASTTTYQAVQSGTDISYTSIAATAPYLHNGINDPAYTETAGTAAGKYYSYCVPHKKWELGDPHAATYVLKEWQWASDYSSAIAVLKCEQDEQQIISLPAQVASETTAATCDQAGSIVYTATVVKDDQTYTDTQTVTIPATGHNYGTPTYTWSDDNKKVTAKVVCANDPGHIITETVDTTDVVTTPPGCETTGIRTCTATFENNRFQPQTKEIEIPATGHEYGEPTYSWSADNKTVTARAVCTKNPDHVAAETVNTVFSETTPAGCETTGTGTYTAAFSNELFTTQTKTEAIEVLGHNWGEPSYEWTGDNSKVTATRSCDRCQEKETETANTSYAVTTQPGCETTGVRTYTATFENNRFQPQTKEIEIPATGHEYGEPTYNWSANKSSVTARVVCENDTTHVIEETVSSTNKVTTPAECEKAGERTYTASFTNDLFTTQTETEVIEALGHKWSEPVYTWSDDNSKVTAVRACDRCHKEETETADTTYAVTTQPGCATEGKGTYTAAFTNEVFTEQTREVSVDAVGHKWSEPSYKWSDDKSSVTASITCANDPTHVVTETVSSTSEVTTPAECEKAGEKTYTAVFSNDLFKKQTRIETIAALEHNWSEPAYEWAADNSKVTALRTCGRCQLKESETADTSYAVTKEPTPEEKGIGTYTAEFEKDAFKKQTRNVVIPATGHTYSFDHWDWADDCSDATLIMKREDNQTVNVTDVTITRVVKDATCTEAGTATYTAKAVFNEKEYTDTRDVTIQALGHDYKHKSWEWEEDYSAAKAIFECSVCGDEKKVSAGISEETAKPTCETDGRTVYKAAAEYGDTTYTDTKEKALPAFGHEWGSPVYTWADDNSAVTAKVICQHDKGHVLKETVPVSRKVLKKATCETNGRKEFRASFTNKLFAEQTKTFVLKATGHKWNDGVVTKQATVDKDGVMTYTCQNCKMTRTEVIPKIHGAAGDKDAKDSVFNKLRLRSPKQTKTSFSLVWKPMKKASRYVLYGNRCGTANKMKKLKTFKAGRKSFVMKSVLGKKVSKGRYYKLMLVAYDKKGKKLAGSKIIHVVTKGGKYTNYKSVTTRAKKNTVTLKKGKKYSLKAKAVKINKKQKVQIHRSIMYECSKKGIVIVSKKGVIKGLKKGACYVYAYTQNGVFKSIKVTVK